MQFAAWAALGAIIEVTIGSAAAAASPTRRITSRREIAGTGDDEGLRDSSSSLAFRS